MDTPRHHEHGVECSFGSPTCPAFAAPPERVPLVKLCARHSFRLFLNAFGTLLDLSGKLYPKWSAETLSSARECEACQRRSRASLQ